MKYKSMLFTWILLIFKGVQCFLMFSKSPFLPNIIWVDFYVLACSSDIFQPILDFLGSADSWDPKDFKTGLKKAIEGHMKVVQNAKRNASN